MLRNQNTAADVRNGNQLDAAGNVLGHVARRFTSRALPDSSGKRRGGYCPEGRCSQQGNTMASGTRIVPGSVMPVLLEETTRETMTTGSATAAIWARLVITSALSS